MAAFSQPGAPAATFGDLHMRRPVQLGTKDLLADCSQLPARDRHCLRLGWRVYTSIEPVSVTDSELVVDAIVVWPDRSNTRYVQGVAPTGHATLVGFNVKVYFVSTPTGEWKLSKVGTFEVE
jgi:hypothetical protein